MSYAATTNLFPDNSTDAGFRAWGSAVSAAISSMGLVVSSDTGQINWTTVTKPASTSTSQGYEIWKFNDSLQATVPIFIKIEYGSGLTTANNPSLWITIGSASNGSGTLTGQTNTRIVQNSNATSSSASYTCLFSGDTNRVGMALFTNLTSAAQAWFLERTKNSDGTDSSLGVMFTTFSTSNARLTQFIPATGAVPTSNADTNIQPPVTATSGGFGTELAFYPNIHSKGGSYLNVGTCCVGYFNADILRDTTFVATLYNTNHTFYTLGNTSNLASGGRAAFTNICIAMRYE